MISLRILVPAALVATAVLLALLPLSAVAARAVVNSVINNRGVIQANSIGTHKGMIVLGGATTKVAGGPVQKVKVAGTLSAAGNKAGEQGGTVQITGNYAGPEDQLAFTPVGGITGVSFDFP